MANPLFAEPRGGVRSPDFREEDIARLFDSVALELTERLQAAPDAEASLTLLAVMKERPDLCRRYFQFVPIGLRGGPSTQAASDLVGNLALKKAGRAADGKYDYQATMCETSRRGTSRNTTRSRKNGSRGRSRPPHASDQGPRTKTKAQEPRRAVVSGPMAIGDTEGPRNRASGLHPSTIARGALSRVEGQGWARYKGTGAKATGGSLKGRVCGEGCNSVR